MTAQDYKNAGYRMSAHMSQAVIDRAEADVKDAYITPINPALDSSSNVYKQSLMCLSYFLILKRMNVFATPSGAKVKKVDESSDSEPWYNLYNMAYDCHFSIERLKATEGSKQDPIIQDICGIYFKTNFINN